METHYTHTDSMLEKLFTKLDNHEDRVDSRFRTLERIIYIGFGLLIALQFAISNGIIKVG